MQNSVWLQFSTLGSYTEQVLGDALKLEPLNNRFARLAVQKADVLYDIAHLSHESEHAELPLDVSATQSGSFTLSATDVNLPDSLTVYLVDHELKRQERITDGFNYQLTIRSSLVRKESPVSILQGPLLARKSESNRFSLIVSSNGLIDFDENSERPEKVSLDQNFPNPFNPSTTIRYSIPVASNVNLIIYDMIGRKVTELIREYYQPGEYTVSFDATSLSSGVYMYQLTAGQTSITKKMTVVK
ncbi:MAG: T9SS C-terminal target domain-containing protein [Balneolaceae bacterium]|nr:MAG: T9SS C-terminal target domain-containing protein [Balneolaceae bacterium]